MFIVFPVTRPVFRDSVSEFQMELNQRQCERVMFEIMMRLNFPEKKLRSCPYQRSPR